MGVGGLPKLMVTIVNAESMLLIGVSQRSMSVPLLFVLYYTSSLSNFSFPDKKTEHKQWEIPEM